MTSQLHGVLVIGADATRVGDLLRQAGVSSIAVLDHVESAEFDDGTHTWLIWADAVEPVRARVLVDTANDDTANDDNGAPYLGVAVHGRPNRFLVHGSRAVVAQQILYVAGCVAAMDRRASTRMEVRLSAQRAFDHRNRGAVPAWPGSDAARWQRMRRKVSSAFDFSSLDETDTGVYDGPAALGVGEATWPVRARLTGLLDPIDGRYHWRGTVSGDLPETLLQQSKPASLTVGERTAEARIAERTPWGSYSVTGVGLPPFAFDEAELAVSQR